MARAALGAVVCALLFGACASLPRPPWAGPDLEKQARLAQQKKRMDGVVRSYQRVRYRLGGKTRRGVDCSGLTMRIYESIGIKLPHNAEAQLDAGRSVRQSQLQYGDLLFFNTKRLAHRPCTCLLSATFTSADVPLVYGVTHTGMYVGDGRFVHAGVSTGVTYAQLEDDYWQKRLVAIRRILEDFDED